MTPTVRETCLVAIEAMFTAMDTTAPIGDPFDFKFDVVQRTDFTDAQKTKNYSLAIMDTVETERQEMGRTICDMTVILEAKTMVPSSANASTWCNTVLGNMKRCVRQDITLGRLARLIHFSKSEIDASGAYTPTANITIWMNVQYSHDINDPRKPL